MVFTIWFGYIITPAINVHISLKTKILTSQQNVKAESTLFLQLWENGLLFYFIFTCMKICASKHCINCTINSVAIKILYDIIFCLYRIWLRLRNWCFVDLLLRKSIILFSTQNTTCYFKLALYKTGGNPYEITQNPTKLSKIYAKSHKIIAKSLEIPWNLSKSNSILLYLLVVVVIALG